MTLDDAGAPFEGQSGGDCVEVLTEERGELCDRDEAGLFSLANPVGQQLTPAVADKVGEGSGEVAGPRDVRAGETDLVELLNFLGAEAVAVPHDPCGDPAQARDPPGGREQNWVVGNADSGDASAAAAAPTTTPAPIIRAPVSQLGPVAGSFAGSGSGSSLRSMFFIE